MKRLLSISILLSLMMGVMGQSTGDWQTRGSGDWDDNTIWQTYNGSSWDNAGSGEYPDWLGYVEYTVYIRDGHTVDAVADIMGFYGTESIVIDDGGTLNMGSNAIYSLDDPSLGFYDVTINGTLTTNTYVNSINFTIGSTGHFETAYFETNGYWWSSDLLDDQTIDVSSGTFEYSYSGSQDIQLDYSLNNLILDGSGTKTLGDDAFNTATGDYYLGGNLTIDNGVTFNCYVSSLHLDNATITNNGTFTSSNSAAQRLYFDGTGAAVVEGSGTWSNFGSANYIYTDGSFGSVTFNNTNTFSIYRCFIYGTGSINFSDQAQFTANSLFRFFSSASLNINSSSSGTGSLILSQYFGSSATVTSQRYIPTQNRWHLISSPLPGQTIQSFLTANSNIPTQSGDYAMTDYSSGAWNSYFTSSTSGNLTSGKGFLVRISSGTDLTYTGTPLTSNQSVSVSSDAFNCIGNPFTSSIDVRGGSGFLATNTAAIDDSYEAIYVWNEQADYSGKNRNDYTTINAGGGSTYIQPGQAFMVRAASGASSMAFNTSMRAHQNPTFYKSKETVNPKLVIQAENEDAISTTDFFFINGMSYGLDPGYDAGLFGANDELSLYSQLIEDNGVDFMVQALPDEGFREMEVALGLVCGTPGMVTFSISEQLNLPDGAGAVLEDRELEIFTDLKKGDYVVNIESACSGTGRFYLHPYDPEYEETGILQDLNEIHTFAHEKDIHIQGNIMDHTSVYLADLSGRVVKSWQVEAGNHHVLNARDVDQGIYILMVSGSGKQTSTKLRID